MSLSISVDATKVVKANQLSARHKVIVGKHYPNHFISIENMTNEQIVEHLKHINKDKSDNRASEVKIAVICMQCAPEGFSPYFVICGRPQSINESNNFAYEVIDSVDKVCKELDNTVLLNCAVDGVSCEASWCRSQVDKYLVGKQMCWGSLIQIII